MKKLIFFALLVSLTLTGCSNDPMDEYANNIANIETWNEFAEKIEEIDNLIIGTNFDKNSFEKMCDTGYFSGEIEIAYTPVTVSISHNDGKISSITYFIKNDNVSFDQISKAFDITGDPIKKTNEQYFKDGNISVMSSNNTITVFHGN